MGLGIYSTPNENSILSVTNPFTVTFDGRIGGAQDKLIFIRNNDTTRWYSTITLQVVDSSDINIVNGSTTGWFWKLLEKDIPPTNKEWLEINAGNTLTLSANIGNSIESDIITYLPVWVRVKIPISQRIQTIVDVVFRLEAQEKVV